MDELDRVLQGDDVDGLALVEIPQQRGQRGGFSGAGGARHQDQAVLLLGHLPECVRQLEIVDGRDQGLQFPHDDRIVSPLGEDVDAEPGLPGQEVRTVAGPLLQEHLAQPAVVVHEIEREDLGLKGGQVLDRRGELYRDQLAGRFHLQRAVHREVQVRHKFVRVEHRGHQRIHLGFSHDTLLRRRYPPHSSGVAFRNGRNFALSMQFE